VEGGQVDEPRLTFARSHPGPDARLLADPHQVLLAVARLPDGGRGYGQDLVHAVALAEPLVFAQDFQAADHGGDGKMAADEGGGPQPHHLLLARDHVEAAGRAHVHDHEVNRVRAQVDGGDLHGTGWRRAGCIVLGRVHFARPAGRATVLFFPDDSL
jgi:hypothetical protein